MFDLPKQFKECKNCFKVKELGGMYYDTFICTMCADNVGNEAYRKAAHELAQKVDPRRKK